MDGQCTDAGCTTVGQLRRGLCQMHYRRLMTTGTTDAPPSHCPSKHKLTSDNTFIGQDGKPHCIACRDARTASAQVCSDEGCNDPVLARGWCRKHYLRWYKYGDTGTPPRFVKHQCSIDGCDGEADTRGWCRMHYRRWQRTGTTDDPPAKPAECAEDGCTSPPRSRGWCKPHYKQLTGQGSAHEMKRYALKLGTRVEDVSYEEVVARHGMTCHICLKPIGSRSDLQIDHVIPLGRNAGGTHTYDNLKPAHKRCNQIKNARPLEEAIALLREEITSS